MSRREFRKIIFIFVVAFIVSFFYKIFVLPLNGDEVWCYGFSYNIAKGLVIYRDFNVMVTPLYFFLSSFFIHIFGNYLISIHLFDCILIGFLAVILYKQLGWYKLFLLFPLIVIYYFPSYNYFCMFLLFVIIYLLDNKREAYYDVISLVAGLILISKQSIGILMLIPVLFYSKHKLRSLVVYFFPFIIVSAYLFLHGAFFDFINYCFLGMLDFGESNREFSIFFLSEIWLCLYLVFQLFKGKFRDKKYFFILMFQVNSYPIFDAWHFVVCLIPVVYCIVENLNIGKLRSYYRFLLMSVVWSIFVIYILKTIFTLDYHIDFNQEKFWYLRNNNGGWYGVMEESKVVRDYFDQYDNFFIIGVSSYTIKLYNDMSIGQYDLLSNGNLGYHGDSRVIQEIDDICQKESCVFFIEKQEFKKYSQFSRKIYSYVLENYHFVSGNEIFFVYEN